MTDTEQHIWNIINDDKNNLIVLKESLNQKRLELSENRKSINLLISQIEIARINNNPLPDEISKWEEIANLRNQNETLTVSIRNLRTTIIETENIINTNIENLKDSALENSNIPPPHENTLRIPNLIVTSSVDISGVINVSGNFNVTNKSNINDVSVNNLFIKGKLGLDKINPIHSIDVSGNISANNFYGNGANLTNLNGSNISTGTVVSDRIDNLDTAKITTGVFPTERIALTTSSAGRFDTSTTNPTSNNRLNYNGNFYANNFYGNGSNLTNLNGSNITTGTVVSARIDNLDTAKITTGVFPTERIALTTSSAGRFDTSTTNPTSNNRLNYNGNFYANNFYGNGANLTNLNGSNISTGTVVSDRIDNLDTAKITTGVFPTERIPILDTAKITTGVFPTERIALTTSSAGRFDTSTTNPTSTNRLNYNGNLYANDLVASNNISALNFRLGSEGTDGGFVGVFYNYGLFNVSSGPAIVFSELDDYCGIVFNQHTSSFTKTLTMRSLNGNLDVAIGNLVRDANNNVINGTSYATALHIKNDGNVGIKNTNPSVALDVTGDLAVSGTFTHVPTGTIILYGSATAPAGFLLCNGNAVSRTTYSRLFSVISTTYGVGDNSTTFNLPDFKGRAPIGLGQGVGLTNRNLGNKVGAETHTLSVAEMPAHNHTASTNSTGAHTHTGTTSNEGSHTHSGTIGSAGKHKHDRNWHLGAADTGGGLLIEEVITGNTMIN